VRAVRYSKTFNDQLIELIEYGERHFGRRLAAAKQKLVYATTENYLAHFPAAKRPDSTLGLTIYPIDKTPFVILYDYDDAELRVHFVFHRRADLTELDPASAEW
jgi:plasmid stabilization system protein ParE